MYLLGGDFEGMLIREKMLVNGAIWSVFWYDFYLRKL